MLVLERVWRFESSSGHQFHVPDSPGKSKEPRGSGVFCCLFLGFRPFASKEDQWHPNKLMAFLMAFCWDAISWQTGCKAMPLNDARIRALKPSPKPTKHGDTGGLLLVVRIVSHGVV